MVSTYIGGRKDGRKDREAKTKSLCFFFEKAGDHMFVRFNEIPSMPLEYIKETQTYGDNMKTVYPPQTQFAGEGGGGNSIMNFVFFSTIW